MVFMMPIIERRGSKFTVKDDDDDTNETGIPVGSVEAKVGIGDIVLGPPLILHASTWAMH